MSLRDNVAKAMENFDAKKEAPKTGFEVLPDGDYYVILEGVEHFVSKSGYESLRVSVSVAEGEQVGRTDSNFFNLVGGGKVPEVFTDQAIQTVARLANAVGLTLEDDDWEDYDTLSTAFMEYKGKTMLMHFSSKPNKKNPQYVNKSYDFEPAEQPDEIEIDDSEIPF
ncbi:DUF669 domain-containing protein [Loigolactobacillus coryniformis]|uniref:DUF669 domain-containing protein n=1 Tax=Loigolactobacillus coryniformis TaxID=1610 RepID=UPI00345CCEBD